MGVFRRSKRTSSDRPNTPSGGGGENGGLFSRIFGRKPAKSSHTSRETARKRRSVQVDALRNNSAMAAAPSGKRNSVLPPASASAPVTPAATRVRKETASSLSPSTGGNSDKERGSGLFGFVRKKSTMSLRSSLQPTSTGSTSSNANTNWTAPNGRLASAPLYDKLASRPLTAYETEPAQQTPTPTKSSFTDAPDALEAPPSAMDRWKRTSIVDKRASTMRAPPPPRPSIISTGGPETASGPNTPKALDDAPPPLPPKPATIGRGAAPATAASVLAQAETESPVEANDEEQAFHTRAMSPPPRPASALETLEMTAPLSLSPSLTGGAPQMPKGASLVRGRSISGPGRSVNSAVTTVTTTADEGTVISPPPVPQQEAEAPVLRSAGESIQSGTRLPVPRKSVIPPQGSTPLTLQLPDEPFLLGGDMVLPSPVGLTVEYMPGSPNSEAASPNAAGQRTSVGPDGIASAAAVGAVAAAVFADAKDDDGKNETKDDAVKVTESDDLAAVTKPITAPSLAPALSLASEERPMAEANIDHKQDVAVPSPEASVEKDPSTTGSTAVKVEDQLKEDNAEAKDPPKEAEEPKAEVADWPQNSDKATEVEAETGKPAPVSILVAAEPAESVSDCFETPMSLVSPTQIPSPAAHTTTFDLTEEVADETRSSIANGERVLSPAPASPISTPALTNSSDSTVLSRSTAVSTPTIPLDKFIPDSNVDHLVEKVTVQDAVTAPVSASPTSSAEELAATETISTTAPVLPSINVATTFNNESDDDDATPPLSPTDSPIMTAEFKAATAIPPTPALPPKDTPSIGLGNGPATPQSRIPSVGTATSTLASITQSTADSLTATTDAPVVPAKDAPSTLTIPGGGLNKTLSFRGPSKPSTPVSTPQRAHTLTPRRATGDGSPSPRTPSSYRGSPRSPSTPATPGTPGTPGSDATLDEFMGLFKTVISRDKGMSIRDAARRAENRV